ncbi:MAG TPA: hypothetical protein VF892_03140, partial [Pseudonocardiaceae bacterium]
PALPIETPFTGRLNGHTPNGDGHTTNGHGPADLVGAPAPVTESEPAAAEDAVPEWAAFRGPLIRDLEDSLVPTDFTWFIPEFAGDDAEPLAPPRPVAPAAAPDPAPSSVVLDTPAPPADEPVSYAYTAVGLPRRVPRSHAVPSLVEQRPPTPAPAPTATAAPTAQRNPSRARGFLNDYQSGIRQGARNKDDTVHDTGNGENR